MELDNLMNSIKENILDLQKKNYPKNVLVQNALKNKLKKFTFLKHFEKPSKMAFLCLA